ncbi:MAG: NAD(+) diphosphatase [Pseudomonadota bacterium]
MPDQALSNFVHTFAGNPLDRGEALRRDEATLASLQADAEAVFLPFKNLRVGVTSKSEDGDAANQALDWVPQGGLNTTDCQQIIFLGIHNNRPHFAAALTPDANYASADFVDCRILASLLPVAETGILAQARAQLDWHQRNPFCAQCGNATEAQRGGQIRRCHQCDKHTFPRTDPVAIMLIVDKPGGDRCLLGKPQGRFAKTSFYTALAGFLDQGESLEEAVRREVWEEAGIQVGHVQYHSSQPWPFPSQLMIGCHGIAETQQINMDEVEMADVAWFGRDEVLAAIRETNADLQVPGQLAIAHHLIRAWAEDEVQL